jgi:hypothetical protein
MQKTIIGVVSLLVALTILLYGYEFIFKKPVIEAPIAPQEEQAYKPALEVKEQYKNSVYTFAGSVSVPNPCYKITSKVNTLPDNAYQIEITSVPPASGVVCAQVITDKKYKVSFTDPDEISLGILFDGITYGTDRFVIPLGENIDTFEIYTKG